MMVSQESGLSALKPRHIEQSLAMGVSEYTSGKTSRTVVNFENWLAGGLQRFHTVCRWTQMEAQDPFTQSLSISTGNKWFLSVIRIILGIPEPRGQVRF